MSKHLIELENVNKTFNVGTINEISVINNLNLNIKKGDFITVIGGNGAGKSTLLNLISGTHMIDSGEIRMNGKSIKKLREEKRAKTIARVFQDPRVGTAPRMTIAENLAIATRRGERRLFGRTLTNENKEKFAKALSNLNLGLENRLDDEVDLLSGGQRQSIALLMATIKKPELLLLDEHTAALDPKAAEQVMAITKRRVQEEKITTLMITHNMKQAIDYGNRLIMLKNGLVFMDIKGKEKENLTVDKLLDLFQAKASDSELSDRLLLSE